MHGTLEEGNRVLLEKSEKVVAVVVVAMVLRGAALRWVK